MPKRIIDLSQRLSCLSGLAGVALMSRPGQGPQPSSGSYAGIVVAVAVLGPIVLGGIAAVLVYVLGRAAPPAAIGELPATPKPKPEVIPAGVHMPPPSIRPLIISLGLTLIAFGVITRDIAIALGPDFNIPIVLTIGVLIMAVGLFGWVRDDYRQATRR